MKTATFRFEITRAVHHCLDVVARVPVDAEGQPTATSIQLVQDWSEDEDRWDYDEVEVTLEYHKVADDEPVDSDLTEYLSDDDADDEGDDDGEAAT